MLFVRLYLNVSMEENTPDYGQEAFNLSTCGKSGLNDSKIDIFNSSHIVQPPTERLASEFELFGCFLN